MEDRQSLTQSHINHFGNDLANIVTFSLENCWLAVTYLKFPILVCFSATVRHF